MRNVDSGTRKSANRTQTPDTDIESIPTQVVDSIGGGGWTRTNDLRIRIANTVGYLAAAMLKAMQQGDVEGRLRA
jgi:hypothetical protein